MSKKYGIADFKHRIVMCSSQDVVSADGEMTLNKVSAWEAWAHVEEMRGSYFSREGYAIKEGRESPSHKICIRYRQDKEISSAAWIYEERRKSSPRWFKILEVRDVGELGRHWALDCRLVQRSDMVVKPAPVAEPVTVTGAVPLPDGVRL
ncbi:MAG: phage head completion protein [Beijerinckiaceae bacterium]